MPEDEPIEAEFEVVKQLKSMSVQFRTDLAKAHPMPQKTVVTIKETIRDQWQREQKEGKERGADKKGSERGKDREKSEERENSLKESKSDSDSKSKSQGKGQSHSH